MKILSINREYPDKNTLEEAARVIKRGGVVMFPSDTCYGLAVDMANQTAVEKLFAIKGREPSKAVSAIYKSMEQVQKWASISAEAKLQLEQYLPGPYTIILPANENYSLRGKTVGVRIPGDLLTGELSRLLANPYSATSANISGLPSCYSVDAFIEQIRSIVNQNIVEPDLVLDAGTLPRTALSTLVNLTSSQPHVINRE
jgi:L-threonylcarbamoyladenylate synthase